MAHTIGDQIKRFWTPLSVAGSWIGSIVTAAILPLSIGLSDADTKRIVTFTALLCAISLAVLLLVSKKLLPKLPSLIWGGISLVFFILAAYKMYSNYTVVNNLSCVNATGGQRAIRGTQVDPYAFATFRLRNPVDYCPKLWLQENGKSWTVPELWTQSSIAEVRAQLFSAYIVCFPLMAIAIYCGSLALFQPDGKARQKG